MDIGVWLRGLGLSEYEPAFRENKIDADVLAELTDEDLRQLGLKLGDRKRLTKAIAGLGAAETSTKPAAPADAAERRQLTVMFSDLVGSTALSSRLDPEDMRRVIRAYQDAVSGVVARYDGFVAKFMGDGVLAYFGFPRAHEDDAARAVHAGLEIARVVAGLETPSREKLAARIGVATGLVVVGDIVGEGAAQEQAVVGDTPNLAARLQGLADAGGLVISAATRRLVGDSFRLKDLGKHAVKGLAEPVEAFAAIGVAATESRFEAAHAARLGGFVGREAESADLQARQRRAWEGRGQIVLISGEAGIGKSRLSAWVAEQAAEIAHTKLRYQCSPYHRDSALYPFAQQFERAAGYAAQDSPEAKLDKLEKVLALATDRLDEVAPLIAAMLSIPTGSRYPALSLSPAQQRRQTLFALLDQMEGLAKKQPVLMLFEDAHWADATSLEVIDLAIERMRKLPVLLLITFRPEFEAPWKGLPDVADIALGRLERAEAEGLVNQVTGGRKLPPEVLAQIVAKTDGVPLFVEELTKNVLESGLLVEDGERYRLDGPLPPLAIPSTLQDSLMARLDRLAAVKEIAQIGAAIGREFSYALLQAVVGHDETTLLAALAQLEESELVFRAGDPPAARYTFKHALVQDTAYESLLKSRRQILHQRIAEALRDKFPDVVGAEPELIAEHYTRAGLTEPAIVHWGKAGDLALRRSAFKEAIAHLGKAIEMTEAGTGEKTGGKLKLHVAYGNALFGARGLGAPETSAAFARASELAASASDSPEQYSITHGMWVGAIVRGELGPARQHALSFLRQVSGDPHSAESGVAHRVNGITNLVAGEFVEARHHLDQALSIFDPRRDRDLAFRFGQDAAVSASSFLAITLWLIGEFERARRMIDETAARITQIDHLASIAQGHNMIANFAVIRQDFAKIAPHSEALARLLSAQDMPLWRAQAAFYEGCVAWHAGDSRAGLEQMRLGLAQCREQKLVFLVQIFMTALASAESQAGEHSNALTTIDEAIDISKRTGFVMFDAESHRTRGEILARQNPADAAPPEAAFLTAIAVAQSQKARSFELRAALALAKLYQSTNRAIEAHDVLGPALEGFSPTPEFPEIAEAKGLFEALAADERVKAEAARRAQRLKLQTSYGHAVMHSKGYAAEETKAAFARVGELATEIGNAEAPLEAYFGGWVHHLTRGELGSARETAESFLREAERVARPTEAAVAHRCLGLTRLTGGDFVAARAHCEQTLRIYDTERDGEAKSRLGADARVAATAYLALAVWCLGEVARSRELIDESVARAVESAHAPTLALAYSTQAVLECLRDDAEAARRATETCVAISQEHGLAYYQVLGALPLAWVRAKLGDRDVGAAEFRQALAEYARQGAKFRLSFFRGRLAEIESEGADAGAELGGIDEALALADETGEHWCDAELHRIRGEILLKQTPVDAASAEAAFLAAIAIAQQQKARSFELRAALALAKLYQSTNRAIEAHDVLGPALEGFSPTPEFPEIAEAIGLLESLAKTDGVKTASASKKRRLQLQVSYGNAVIAASGHGSRESTAAFSRAREMATGVENVEERFSINYGLWAGSVTRGELGAMRELASEMLSDCASRPNSPEASTAHRVSGATHMHAGEYVEAREHLDRALALFDSERDGDLKFRQFGDIGVATMATSAVVYWVLGHNEQARRFVDDMVKRADQAEHVATATTAHIYRAAFENLRRDLGGAAASAEILAGFSRDHQMLHIADYSYYSKAWAAWKTSEPKAKMATMREGLALRRKNRIVVHTPLIEANLAEAEAEAGEIAAALATVDSALAATESNGLRGFDAELHRIRGEILFKQTPADPAAAEAAFLTAISIAQSQKARSFELRAALSLAKLYQATDRAVQAYDVLGPALEGFSPTPEFPEINEAREMLEALAETREVKATAASRLRQVQLQVSLGNALTGARGYGAKETTSAFERARELAQGIDDPRERCAVLTGLWAGSYLRGELGPMRELVDALMRLAERQPETAEAGVAWRQKGVTHLFMGDFAEARISLERALEIFDPVRDGGHVFRYGHDLIVGAAANLARALWPIGEADRARQIAERMKARAAEISHAGTAAYAQMMAAIFEMSRRDFARVEFHARALVRLTREHEMEQWKAFGQFFEGWLALRAGERDDGLARMRVGVDQLETRKIVAHVGPIKVALAEAEAAMGASVAALRVLDEAIAASERNGQRWFDAEFHSARGAILLKQTPADPAAAEAAFLTAIAVARSQKARGFELRAALSLAKLYQSTNRRVEAYEVLDPALEGFSPTPEYPEIGAALELLAAIKQAG